MLDTDGVLDDVGEVHGFGLERNKLMENRLHERDLLPCGIINVVIDHRPLSRHGSVNRAQSRLIVGTQGRLTSSRSRRHQTKPAYLVESSLDRFRQSDSVAIKPRLE